MHSAAHLPQGLRANLLSLLVFALLPTALLASAEYTSLHGRTPVSNKILTRRHAASWRRAEALGTPRDPDWRRADEPAPLGSPDVLSRRAAPNPDWRRTNELKRVDSMAPGPDWRRKPEVSSIQRRASGARFTFFETGLGACGGVNVPSDFVVAMSKQDWDGGSHCGDKITIKYSGKIAHATIVDMCVECPSGALDFTTGLFKYFEPNLGAGTLYGEWSYGDGPDSSPKPSPKPKPSTTSKPTSTQTPSSQSSSSTSSTTSSASTSASASSAPKIGSEESLFIDQLDNAMIDIGRLMVIAASQ